MSKLFKRKADDETPVDEPLKPIRFEALRDYTPAPETPETAERPFRNPQTPKDWATLAKTLKAAAPEQYPTVKPEDLATFKKAVTHITNGTAALKWMLIGILPAAFFMLTDNILHVVQWGALFYFGAVACIIVAQFIGAGANREAMEKARDLGTVLKLLKR